MSTVISISDAELQRIAQLATQNGVQVEVEVDGITVRIAPAAGHDDQVDNLISKGSGNRAETATDPFSSRPVRELRDKLGADPRTTSASEMRHTADEASARIAAIDPQSSDE